MKKIKCVFKKNKVLLCFFFLILLFRNAFGLDLSQAIDLALENDPEFLVAKQTILANREKLAQGQAPLLPKISGTIGNIQNYPTTGESSNITSYGISINQVIFNYELNASQKQSVLSVKEAESNFQSSKQNIFLKITSAFFNVLIAQNDLKTVVAEKKAVFEQLEFAKRNFEVGTSTITDQQEAQARFDLIRATEIKSRNDLAVQRTNLEKMLLSPLPKIINGIDNSINVVKPKITDPKEWMKLARDKNFDIIAAKARLEFAKIELKKSKKYHMPSISATASVNRTDSNTLSVNNGSQTLSLNLSIPFYEGGLYKSELRETIANFNKAQHSLDLALLNADRKAAKSYRNFIAGLAQVEALEAAEKSSKVALESNRLGYEVGVRINIDVLNSQKQLFSSQRDLSKARYDALSALLELKASIGQLNRDEIILVSNLIKNSSN